jgi:uncharacterized protein Smg (DUF494 family)
MRLIRENVEIIVDNKKDTTGLEKAGFKKVETKDTGKELSELTVDQLKQIAAEKEINVPSNVKKEELIKILEGGE